ncbi:VOC family protein [Aeromonas sp. FDAARGOS 1409]|uniref:VOC family protein n=1 Tax=Aeromonas TaxID=642 RepID=UPI001C210D14|nr:VOC family protein [Aeromonas sp. FDAARGOS 1409]QXC28464.1 VOC family protein [Aeromonas sp. FDAARGOS 1409]
MNPVTGLAHIGLRTGDIAAACSFYGSLGFVEVQSIHGDVEVRFMKLDSIVIELYQLPTSGLTRDAQTRGIDHVALRVVDLDDALAWVNALGHPISEGPAEQPGIARYFLINGPDGERIEFSQSH